MEPMTCKELRALARDLSMTGYSKLNKTDLVNAIEKHQRAIAQVEVAIEETRTVEVEAEALLAAHADPEAQPLPSGPPAEDEAEILDAILDVVAPPAPYPRTSKPDWQAFIHACYWLVDAAIALALYASRVMDRAWYSRPAHGQPPTTAKAALRLAELAVCSPDGLGDPVTLRGGWVHPLTTSLLDLPALGTIPAVPRAVDHSGGANTQEQAWKQQRLITLMAI